MTETIPAYKAPEHYRNLFDLTGKTAVVTGGAQGMGLEMARAFADHGTKVVLIDLNGDALVEAAKVLEQAGAAVSTVTLDITDPDAADRILGAARELGGQIDILVNNAGILSNSAIPDLNFEDWDRVMKVNLRAPVVIMKAVLDDMATRESGVVINIGSSWSSRGAAFNQSGGGSDYCASKAALQAFTRSAAQDYAPRGLRINAIAPGAVDTGMHAHHREFLYEYEKYIPVGRMQLAHDVAGAAVFLASPASSYITGQTIHVNGGLLMVD